MKNQPYIPERNWLKWLIVSLAIATVLAVGIYFMFIHFEPTGVDAQVWDLIEELKGYPSDYFEETMEKCGLDSLLKKKPTARKSCEIVDDLVKIGTPAVPKLIELLKYKYPSVRSLAANALGRIRDRRAVESLVAALKDKRDRVAYYAAWSLGQIGDPRATSPLLAVLKDVGERDNVRLSAAGALGEIGDMRAVDPLITLLNDKKLSIRHAASLILNMIPNNKVEKILKPHIEREIRRFVQKGLSGDNKAAAKYDEKIFLQQFEFKRGIYFIPIEKNYSQFQFEMTPDAMEKTWTDKFAVAQEIKYRWNLDNIGPLTPAKDEDQWFIAKAKIKLKVLSRHVIIGKANIPETPAGMKIWQPFGLRGGGSGSGPRTRYGGNGWCRLPIPIISSNDKIATSPEINQAKITIRKTPFQEDNYSIELEIFYAKIFAQKPINNIGAWTCHNTFPWKELPRLKWGYGIPDKILNAVFEVD